MAIKPNNTRYDVESENPLVDSLYNYGFSASSVNPLPENKYMITEITEDRMITESGDYMITEF